MKGYLCAIMLEALIVLCFLAAWPSNGAYLGLVACACYVYFSASWALAGSMRSVFKMARKDRKAAE